MQKRKIIIAGAVLFSTLAVCSISIWAWFYAPNKRKTNINTENNIYVNTALYKLNNYSAVKTSSSTDFDNGLYYVSKTENGITEYEEASGTYDSKTSYFTYNENGKFDAVEVNDDSYSISQGVTFFQWGTDYIAENDITSYYALELTLESDSLMDSTGKGYFMSILNNSLVCTSDVTYKKNGETIPLRFPLIKMKYKYGTSDLDLGSQTSITTAKASSGYEEISFTGTDNPEDESFVLSSELTRDFSLENDYSFYRKEVTSGGVTSYQIHMVLFFIIEADTTSVTNYMKTASGFGSASYINITNTLTVNPVIRSVPKKSA